jgi:hypothetical protein
LQQQTEVCHLRSPFAANGHYRFPLVSFCVYIYIMFMYIYILPFQMEYRSPADFPSSVFRLLIMQTEVCRLSVCWRRNKRKLSICEQTKWTCLSM